MTAKNKIIDDVLQTRLPAYLDEISVLCAQPSVSAKHEGINECAALVLAALQKHGVQAAIYQTAGHPVVMGRAAGKSDKTLLCYNHYDVQPVEPLELWETPPFQPSIRDGKLFARGSRDDKGELISRLAALDAVREANGGELPCSYVFVVDGEEEVGSPNMPAFVQAHLKDLASSGALWEEGGIESSGAPYCSLGCRGILAVELSITTMKTDAHSGRAHFLHSAAWRLVRLLNALKDENDHINIAGFYDDARPPLPLDLELLDALPSEVDLHKQIYGIEKYHLNRTESEVRRAVFQPTMNIEGISTGYTGEGMKTVIPAKASVKIDFRLVPDQDPQDCLRKLKAHLVAIGYGDVDVKYIGSMAPSRTRPDDPLVKLVAQAAAEVYPVPALLYPMVGGSSPIYAFKQPLGNIPVVNPGIGYWDNRAHAPNEHIRIDDFAQATRHIARVMDGFASL